MNGHNVKCTHADEHRRITATCTCGWTLYAASQTALEAAVDHATMFELERHERTRRAVA
ncbi:hypothetical protein [Demequina sp. NBRC 110055]|uniref:hypothetical protein n=1 Tax=Demequina sp. NBRC 110055 TaxID=1570344 RepID=UPI0013563887|nr:hypothetical protein [Demequina sp. NBRC 110055]